ncbi:MAG: hypothetical protein AAB152_04175 [Candidatus Coatesbacteria bacterium]
MGIVPVALVGLWGVLAFANYLAVHGFGAELNVPLIYLRQWHAAWPGQPAATAAGLRHASAAAAALAVLLAGAGAGGALAGWVAGRGGTSALDRLALGAGLTALAVLGLGLAGLAAAPVFGGLVLAGLAWSAPPLVRGLRAAVAWRSRDPWTIALAGLAACLLAQDLLAALAPEWYYDALLYHLAVPARILLDHRFVLLEGHMQFSFPLNPEMLYTAAMALGGETAAKLVNLGLWVLAFCAVARLARVLLPAPLAGLLAAVLFYAQPMLAAETESAFAESGWTLWIALAAAHAVGARQRGGLAAAYAGFAAGAKYIGLIEAVPVGLLLVTGPRRRGAAAAAFLFGAIAAPWYVKNWIFQLDPFFPTLAPYGLAFGFTDDKLALKKLEVAEYGLPVVARPWLLLALPWDFVQHDLGGRYWQETSGPLLLALAPVAALALLARRDPAAPGLGAARRLAFLSAVWALIWAGTNQWNRLLLPALAPATAVLAWAVVGVASTPFRRVLLAAVVAWAGWCNILRMDHHAAVERFYELDEAVTGRLDHAGWQARYLPTGPILAPLRKLLPPGAKVLLVYEQLGYGVAARHVWESVQSRALLARVASESSTLGEMRKRLHQQGITHVLINRKGAGKAREWGQYGGLSMRSEGQLATFAAMIEPPDLVADAMALYVLPPPPRAATSTGTTGH